VVGFYLSIVGRQWFLRLLDGYLVVKSIYALRSINLCRELFRTVVMLCDITCMALK
jgi:hypothetical protein